MVNLAFFRLDPAFPSVNLNCFRFNSFIIVFEKFILSEGVGKPIFGFRFSWESGVNQIIGITSLCLYHTAFFPEFQDGMVPKIQLRQSYKREKMDIST